MDSSFASGNIHRYSGLADKYNNVRPSPPEALRPVLCGLAMVARPKLVVDLGCGTGLSTRYWADFAYKTVGIDPNQDMLNLAKTETVSANIAYVEAMSHRTPLMGKSADIVTCSQSFHWMEPTSTLAEAARILRPGGVFAAYDYDWPPNTGVWMADAAYENCMRIINSSEKQLLAERKVFLWPKHEHLKRMAESGLFRYTKEVVMHHEDTGNANRLIGILLSQGSTRSLLESGRTEAELGIEAFRKSCIEFLGSNPRSWHWSSRVRIGVV